MDLVAVVSNHPRDTFPHVDFSGVRFRHLPVTPGTRGGQENHRDTPGALVRKGRDIERRVLASAVNHHLQDRVLLNGNTAIVFAE